MARPELSPASVASIVLDATRPWPRVTERPRRSGAPLPAGSPAALAFGPARPVRSWTLAAALAVAGALHLAAAGLAGAHRAAKPFARPAAVPLRIEHVVELRSPVAPPASRTVRAPSHPARIADPPGPVPEPQEAAPAPAVAGVALAREPEGDQTMDFTGFDLTTGAGEAYAGGVTASAGTSATAVPEPSQGRAAGHDAGAGRSRARPVGLPAREWQCPWPAEARDLALDEQFVVLRVAVSADGSVTAAALVDDPGHGFGAVALACARTSRFLPALDDSGLAVAATSAPIRVRFTR